MRELKDQIRIVILICSGVSTAFTPVVWAGEGGPASEFAPPPIANVQGEFINFETPLIHPVHATTDGRFLIVANEPDNRVLFLDPESLAMIAEVPAGMGLTAVAERPNSSEIWVSAAHSSGVMVIDTTTFAITNVMRPLENDQLGSAATPGGIAFSEDGSKAFVLATSTDALNIYDAAAKKHIERVFVAVPHNGRSTRVREPRSIVRRGDVLYVGVFRSGNQTAAGNVVPLGLHPNILDLDTQPDLSLPDADVVLLSAEDGSWIGHRRGIGSLINDVVINPVSDQLVVSHLTSDNGDFLGEGSFPDGKVTHNQLTYFSLDGSTNLFTQVSLDDLPDGAGTSSLGMPTGLAVDPLGRVFVAAYAASRIGVFDAFGAFEGFIDTDAGPRGLAISPDGTRLYTLNRSAGTVAAYDISGGLPSEPLATVALVDPTYDQVKAGRKIFHGIENSGGRSTGCWSCHADLQADGLAWDLSAYYDEGDGFTLSNPPQFWADRKFSMVTQDVRSLEDTAPYHWRGEKKDLEGFNGAFENLLKGESLSDADFRSVKQYIFSGVFPANPKQPMKRVPSGDAVFGHERFNDRACTQCHALPMGSSGSINGDIVVGRTTPASDNLNTINPPQLRGLWTKLSDATNVRNTGSEKLIPVTGFGLNSKGSQGNVQQFLATIFNGIPIAERNLIEAFLLQLDSGISPAANLATPLNVATVSGFPWSYLLAQTEAGNCDLAITGRIDRGAGFETIGMVMDRDLRLFVADDVTKGVFSAAELSAEAAAGRAELVVWGVPLWSGERIGVDRDRDGLFNGDELAAGTDPTNPDTDGDGFWDSYDDQPLVPDETVDNDQAPVVTSVEVIARSTNSVKIAYTTDTFSPTHVVYGKTTEYGQTVGDDLVLPDGSNHWRRRHSIVLREMEDDSIYHIQILTRGQNGVEGAAEDRVLKLIADDFLGLWVKDITVDAVVEGGNTTLTATVEVVQNQGLPLEGVEIRGFWTLFRNGEPVSQLPGDGGPTGPDGLGTVVFSSAVFQSGDQARFTVPMYRGVGDDAVSGLVDSTVSERVFAWPESLVTEAVVEIP